MKPVRTKHQGVNLEQKENCAQSQLHLKDLQYLHIRKDPALQGEGRGAESPQRTAVCFPAVSTGNPNHSYKRRNQGQEMQRRTEQETQR